MPSKKISAAFRNPLKIPCYILWQWNRLQVRKVAVSSKVYYKYRGALYPDYLNQGNATAFIAERALKYCRGVGLDIGAEGQPLTGATPIRNERFQNPYSLGAFPDSSLEYVFSSHSLEHLDRWREALRLWIRKLRPGGFLVLYLPHESMMMWRRCGPWVGMAHKWTPTYQVLLPFLEDRNMKIVEYNPGRDVYWSFHIVARREFGPSPDDPSSA